MRKGDKTHRRIGKVFAYSMLVAGFSSLLLALLHPNYFLFIVGVFTVYLTATGYRYLHLYRRATPFTASLLDWVITGCMALAGLVFIAAGVYLLLHHNNFGVVLLVFGALSLRFVKTDTDNFRNTFKTRNFWLLAHFQRMTGAYIASITAFVVVNAHHIPLPVPNAVYWLLPTFLILPIIIKWSRKYKGKEVKM